MVMDFSDLKNIVNEEILEKWDHAILLNGKSPHVELGKMLENEGNKVVFCDYQPTCENMLYDISRKIKPRLPKNVELAYLKLHETGSSYCEWFAEDQL